MIVEICAYTIQSCLIADNAEADRIEFCANPQLDGTTPNLFELKYLLNKLNIPVFPIIRPRGGDFVFTTSELETMEQDLLYCKQMGCKGISTGVALQNNKMDIDKMKHFVSLAYPMQVTCHKVFDKVPDMYEAVEGLIEAGVNRILSSGLAKDATAGIENIKILVEKYEDKIIIMPGGGVRAMNIDKLVSQTGAKEYHSSGIVKRDTNFMADESEIRKIVMRLH